MDLREYTDIRGNKTTGPEPCQPLSQQMQGGVSGFAREWGLPSAVTTDVPLTHSLSFPMCRFGGGAEFLSAIEKIVLNLTSRAPEQI